MDDCEYHVLTVPMHLMFNLGYAGCSVFATNSYLASAVGALPETFRVRLIFTEPNPRVMPISLAHTSLMASRNMPTALLWVVRVFTLLTVVGLGYLTLVGIVAGDARIYCITGLLALVFGYFVYRDVRKVIASL